MGLLRHTQFSSTQFCSWTSSFVVLMALVCRLTQSIHLCFGLPLFLLPGGTISILTSDVVLVLSVMTWPISSISHRLHASSSSLSEDSSPCSSSDDSTTALSSSSHWASYLSNTNVSGSWIPSNQMISCWLLIRSHPFSGTEC